MRPLGLPNSWQTHWLCHILDYSRTSLFVPSYMSKSWETCIESSWKGATICKVLKTSDPGDISCYKIWGENNSWVGLDLLDLNNDQLCSGASYLHWWRPSFSGYWSSRCINTRVSSTLALCHTIVSIQWVIVIECSSFVSLSMCSFEPKDVSRWGTMCIFIFVLPEYKNYFH